MPIRRPESASLCTQCVNLLPLLVDISAASKPYKVHSEWWADTFGKAKNIRRLAPDACELCRILLDALVRVPDFNAANTEIKVSHRLFAVCKDLEYNTCEFEACGRRLALAPIRPTVTTDDGELLHAFTGRPIAQIFTPLLAKIWIAKCHQEHTACRPDHSSEEFDFSFRLIDVNEGRLVNAPKNARYLALSYVWGGVKQFMLNNTTKKFLEQPGCISPDGLKDMQGEYADIKATAEAEGRVVPRTIR